MTSWRSAWTCCGAPTRFKEKRTFLSSGRLQGRLCIWGGMNGAVTLGEGTREDARNAVEEAIRVLAPGGGFVLFPGDQIEPGTP